MPFIYSYQKHTDEIRTVEAILPNGVDGEPLGVELATIDNATYICVKDGAALPAQPSEITLEPVELTPELKKAISQASPHVRLINERVVERIRARYSENDELKMARIAWSENKTPEEEQELLDYDSFVELARSWGRDQKAALGL